MIKKYIGFVAAIAVIVFLLVGCDPATDPGFVSPLSPPAWLIGTWLSFDGDYTWTFTGDNAVYTYLVTSAFTDYKEYSKLENVEITDSIIGDDYSINIDDNGTVTGLTFIQQSDTELEYLIGGEIVVPPVDYTKQ